MEREKPMSKLLIKQKVFAIRDKYNVYDEMENPKYFVKGELFRLSHHIHIYDREGGVELGYIQEKLFKLMREFEISINGVPMGIIKKQFALFRPKYNIDYKGWRLEGNFLQWNYSIYEGSRLVVKIDRKLFRWGDTYVLDVANPEDELPALMIAIAMDAARESEQAANSGG